MSDWIRRGGEGFGEDARGVLVGVDLGGRSRTSEERV